MPRTGKGTKVHPNRTDLNTATPSNGTREYGAVTQDETAMEAVPVAPAPPLGPPGPMPGELGRLDAPSNRPDEPLTAGLPIGAGPGPEARLNRPLGTYQTPLQRVAEITQHPRLIQLARSQNG